MPAKTSDKIDWYESNDNESNEKSDKVYENNSKDDQ